jgi:hypothetical protein
MFGVEICLIETGSGKRVWWWAATRTEHTGVVRHGGSGGFVAKRRSWPKSFGTT